MWILGKKGPSGFSSKSTAEQVTQGIDGSGLTAIITGASNGIGQEAARVLASRGVHIVMGVRNVSSGNKVKEQILAETPNAVIDVMEIDLNSLASVSKFAAEYRSSGLPLNILINNAGIMSPPFTLSKDNIEQQFAVNHLGPFHLTNLLLETMKKTASESHKEGRIVNLSSMLHKSGYKEGIRFDKINDESSYNGDGAYGQSKLCNLLHTNELARRLKADGVNITANSLHPGLIATNISHNASFGIWFFFTFGKMFLKTVPQKVVVIVDIHDEKEKKKALKTVSSLSGIESIAIDMKDKKITVIGDVDPIGVVNKLRKLWHAELLSVGPDKEPEKKKEDEEKKKKEEEEKKKNDDKAKDGEVKKDQNEQIQELVKAYHHYNYNPYIMRTPYVVHNPDEYPSSCVIC